MTRLAALLYPVIATAVAGSAVVVALTMGQDTLQPILIAAGAGAAVSLPLSWVIAKQLG